MTSRAEANDGEPAWPELRFGLLTIDLIRRRATWACTALTLRPMEVNFLTLLAWRRGEPVTREELFTLLSDRADHDTRRVDVHVSRIRLALVSANVALSVEAVRGFGYL